MFVTKRKRNSWKNRLEHGDFTAISKKSGFNRQRIARALQDGTMPDQLYYAMHDYFRNKTKG